jgi:hypothetical protein
MYSEPGNTTSQMLQPKLMYCKNQSKYFCSRDTHTLTQHGPVKHKIYDTHTHGPVKHKTNDKQPTQISTTGSKNGLLTSVFKAQNNEPEEPILQEKINNKYNYKLTCVNE